MKPSLSQLQFAKKTSSHLAVYDSPQKRYDKSQVGSKVNLFYPKLSYEDIVLEDALNQMKLGTVPDLRSVCLQLYNSFFEKEATNTALQFVPLLKAMDPLSHFQSNCFEKNKLTNHVLVMNKFLKIVLIHWTPGAVGSIHGHPNGGCVFKVLKGSIEELRYTTSKSPQLLSSSSYHKEGIGYIDDRLGYHAVGNPFNTSAVTLHVYTPGIKD